MTTQPSQSRLNAEERESLGESLALVPGLKSEDVVTTAVRHAAVMEDGPLTVAVEAILAARLAAVEALAGELHEAAQAIVDRDQPSLARRAGYQRITHDLRRALTAAEPATPEEAS